MSVKSPQRCSPLKRYGELSGELAVALSEGSGHGKSSQPLLVSRRFRSDVQELLPGLDRTKGFWSLFGRIVFRDYADKATLEPLVPSAYLGDISGLAGEWHRSKGGAEGYLRAFSEEVFPIRWSSWNYTRSECRRITHAACPAEVLEIVERERGCYDKSDRVLLESGKPWTSGAAISARKLGSHRAEALMARHHGHPAAELARYLNSGPTNLFTRLLKNMPAAHKAAHDLRVPIENYVILSAIEASPKPYYAPGGNGESPRLFATSLGMQNLRRDLREVIAPDWIEADLRSAQLSIVSAPRPVGWDIEAIRSFLANGESIWDHLARSLDIELTPTAKTALKGALYGITYGQGDVKRAEHLSGQFPELANASEAFVTIPIIDLLLQARNREISRIKSQGGATDAFGRFHRVRKDLGVLAILAIVAQSWELRLLLPALQIAKSPGAVSATKGFRIALWSHDGFSVHCGATQRARWTKAISRAVDQEAASLAVPTSLIWSGK